MLVNTDENSFLSNACFETWILWLCGRADNFGFLCQWWMMRYCKHKRGRFLFSQIKTTKIAEFECKKKCFYVNEIANWDNSISNYTLMDQYSQNCSTTIASALCIKVAKKINSDLSCSNSGYNGVFIAFQFAINAERTHFLHKLPSYNYVCKIRNKTKWRTCSI